MPQANEHLYHRRPASPKTAALQVVTHFKMSQYGPAGALRLTEAGLVLIYEPKLARDLAIREARQDQSVPVLVAKR